MCHFGPILKEILPSSVCFSGTVSITRDIHILPTFCLIISEIIELLIYGEDILALPGTFLLQSDKELNGGLKYYANAACIKSAAFTLWPDFISHSRLLSAQTTNVPHLFW
jgi:hypothetical protein